MRIALVCSSLSGGGAARVLSTMANYWAAGLHQVTLLTVMSESSDFYVLRPEVRRIALAIDRRPANKWQAIVNLTKTVLCLRRALRVAQPDVVISFIETMNVLTLLATWGTGTPVIVSERTDPRHHYVTSFWRLLRRLAYPMARAVVVQTAAVAGWARQFLCDGVVHVIPNPVLCPAPVGGREDRPEGSRAHRIISMGRLIPSKAFDVLLRAFATLSGRHPNWSLVLLGEGEERRALTQLAAELGIAHRVSMPGLVQDPGAVLRAADLFVMTSRYEGFPNALCEAMANGLPAIATDCPSGPREILRDGVDGLLVPVDDLGALTASMDRLMAHDEERIRLACQAAEVTERFGLEHVMRKWEDLVERVGAPKLARAVGRRDRLGPVASHLGSARPGP